MRILQIPYTGDASAALRCLDTMLREQGFQRAGADQGLQRRYENPNPWNLIDQHPLRLSSAVVVSAQGDRLRLVYDNEGAKRRIQALLGVAFFCSLLLIMGNFIWANPMQPLHKVLLPVVPWPLLAPVLLRSMRREAHRRWYSLLHMAGRLAGSTTAPAKPETEPEYDPQPV